MRTQKQMTPYVIDGKRRQEYLYLFFFFVAISFGLGYTFGYLHGIPAEAEKTMELNLPTRASTSDNSTSIQIAKIEDNSEIDKSVKPPITQQPQQKEDASTNSPKVKTRPVHVSTPLESKSTSLSTKNIQPQKSTSKPESTAPKSVPQITISKVKQNKKADTSKASTATANKKVGEVAKPKNVNPTQYLVQVGLFASRKNASSFIDKLEESGFEGYFEGFISTSGVEKYNVRLGPFAEKSIAQKKMSDFQKVHNSSAYILTKK